jgi:hypothetical protein
VKRTKQQKLQIAHENSMKKYNRKTEKILVDPCASLHQDMNWPTSDRAENEIIRTGRM